MKFVYTKISFGIIILFIASSFFITYTNFQIIIRSIFICVLSAGNVIAMNKNKKDFIATAYTNASLKIMILNPRAILVSLMGFIPGVIILLLDVKNPMAYISCSMGLYTLSFVKVIKVNTNKVSS